MDEQVEQADEADAGDGGEGLKWRRWQRRPPTVLITGIAGRMGTLLARRLHRQARVLGIDRRAIEVLPRDIEFHQVDLRRRRAEDLFRRERIDALVHLNIMHDPRKSTEEHHNFNIVGTQKMLELSHRYGVRKVIVLSSADVYGPAPTNNQFLTEEAPLMAATRFEAIRDLIAVDMACSSYFWRHPEIETVILRPVHILGSVNNAPSNYLRLDPLPTLLGFDPMVQVMHAEDVIDAILLALRPGLRGVFNLAGPPAAPLSELAARMGRRTLPIPEPLARPVMGLLWRTRLTSFPTPEFDFIKYVCMVDDTRARKALGYAPRFDLDATLAALAPAGA